MISYEEGSSLKKILEGKVAQKSKEDFERARDREEVLKVTYKWIYEGMDSSLSNKHVELARSYGQKYGIEVEDWLIASRRMFSNTDDGLEWAQQLP